MEFTYQGFTFELDLEVGVIFCYGVTVLTGITKDTPIHDIVVECDKYIEHIENNF